MKLKYIVIQYSTISGSINDKSGRHLKSKERYDKALAIDPNYEPALYNKKNRS
jgi:hypothetical protein